MKFAETPLKGAFVIEVDRLGDDRGFFARTFCVDEFAAHGLETAVTQISISFNERRGTLRGMHFQRSPHVEAKVVRCTAGAVFDVIVDLRPGSKTRFAWFGAELTAENRRAMFVPKGFAHGFQTLQDRSEMIYQITPAYTPESAAGFRWNDERVDIRWPLEVSQISQRDRDLPGVAEVVGLLS